MCARVAHLGAYESFDQQSETMFATAIILF